MFEVAKPKVRIADLKHRIALCRMHDVVEKDGTMSLLRESVTWQWAMISDALNLSSFISVRGYSVAELATRPSHRIIIRAASMVEITNIAWIYEQRLKSSPRWYKVLGFNESDHWLVLTCHLVERSMNAQPPMTPEPCPAPGLGPQPTNVELT